MKVPTKAANPVSEGVTINEFVKIIGNRKAFIFLVVFLSVLTTVAVTFFQPKWYKATTSIGVEKPGVDQIFVQGDSNIYDPYFIKEQFEIIQSKQIMEAVIEDDEVLLQRRLSDLLGFELTLQETYDYLVKEMLDMENLTGTSIIEVGVEAEENPMLAQLLSVKIAQHYRDNRRQRATASEDKQIENLRLAEQAQQGEVNTLRERKEKLREELGITDESAGFPSQSNEGEELANLNRLHTMQRRAMIESNLAWERFKNTPEDERIKLLNSFTTPDQPTLDLLSRYLLTETQYASAKAEYGENHPDLINSKKILDQIRGQLMERIEGLLFALESNFLKDKTSLEALETEIEAARTRLISRKGATERKWEQLNDDLQFAEDALKILRLELKQREADREVPPEIVEILSAASVPSRHSKPNMILNIALALVGGTIIGVGCAFLIEYFDTSFRTVEDLEQTLQIPILGVVTKKEVLVSSDNIGSADTEPYRVIQTNLDLAAKSSGGKVYAVQSAGPGEGKSTTLHNIAAVMALVDRRVIIVDSDVRRPSQHKLFKGKSKPGLIDYLTGAKTLDQVIVKSNIPNLDYIPSGHAKGGHFSLSMLHSQKLTEMIEALSARYDRVLMDSPPTIGISDSYVLASLADGVLFVVQHKRNPQSMSIRAKHIIENVEGKIVGVVLNQVPPGGGEDYGYYTSNYYYYSSGGSSKRSSRRERRGSKDTHEEDQDDGEVIENDLESFTLEEPEDTEEQGTYPRA